ncbi:LOW QUALITY PROTEIN: putative PAS fold protein, partial [Streptomyces himastatinicus ATCC 53653]
MTAPQRSEPARPTRPVPAQSAAVPVPATGPGRDDSDLLAALLDGMDAALCAFDAEGTVTHWNREAERILGWPATEAVGRKGLAGWAARAEDARDVEARLMEALDATGRRVHEFALLTKDGGRVLVRTQSSAVLGADGRPAGVYCAFSEVHAQLDLERSIALSEALLADASWSVVLVDADLRVAVLNGNAAGALRTARTAALGRPLGEFLDQGVDEAENALQHVLAEGAPPAPTELWVTLREAADGAPEDGPPVRRCWRSGFLRLASPLTEEPVPLGVAWIFQDVTEAKEYEQESARLRFRGNQLHRAARAAAECEDPMEAAAVHLDFALAGFADHALIDLVVERRTGSGTAGRAVLRRPGADPARPGGGHAVRHRGAVLPGRPGRHPGGLPGEPPGAPGGRARRVGAGERDAYGRDGGGAVGGGPQMAGGLGARSVRGAAQPRPHPGRRDLPPRPGPPPLRPPGHGVRGGRRGPGRRRGGPGPL